MIPWTFPLPSCHHGVPLGNGLLGVLLWGEGRTLHVTLARADLWDHRGGLPWTAEMSYAKIRALLEAGDEAGMRKLFEQTPGKPERPTILPVGRLEVALPGELVRAELDEATGVVRIELSEGTCLEAEVAPRDPVLLLRGAGRCVVGAKPSGGYAKESFGRGESGWASRGIAAPEVVDRPEIRGWTQALPVDPAVCAGYRGEGGDLWVAVDRGADPHAALVECSTLLSRAVAEGAARFSADARAWWAEFWAGSAKVQIPNATLDRLYRVGMYKFAGATNPRGVPCGLQGPWIEDDRLPAWASDYHFNINVQMCYAPAYAGGHGRHLRPLWKLLRGWEPKLREHARMFVPALGDATSPDGCRGLMLPHSVDDRCTNMGGFWAGTIDHGCTAWVAKMMFDAWDHGLEDDAFLAETAWPWLVGALEVYRAMTEERADGSLCLPVSVSPEYRGSAFNAWGADASFQLAACHALIDALDVAARRLGRAFAPEWADLRARLPKACVQSRKEGGWAPSEGGQIMLWAGTPLEESHRHHSHLAAICPFTTIDPFDATWRPIVDASMTRWIERGMGNWSGWCMSWASQLNTRVGNASSAEFILEAFVRYFANDGYGVFHNVLHRGFSTMGGGAMHDWNWQAMQLDGGLNAVAAVTDMLCHARPTKQAGRWTHVLFAGAPATWETTGFEDLRTPGGFTVSAKRERGNLTKLTVKSTRGGPFTWAFGEKTATVETTPGQVLDLL